MSQQEHTDASPTALAERAGAARAAGDIDGALALWEASLEASVAQSDLETAWKARHNLGSLAFERADFVVARRFHNENVAFHRPRGEETEVAYALNTLSNVEWAEGYRQKAVDLTAEAIAIHRRLGHRLELASPLENYGTQQLARGHTAGARAAFEESFAIRLSARDVMGVCRSIVALGEVRIAEKDQQGAINLLVTACDLADSTGYTAMQGEARFQLGRVRAMSGEKEGARALYRAAREYYGTIGNHQKIAATLNNLAGLIQPDASPEKKELYESALVAILRTTDRQNLPVITHNLANCERRAGRVRRSVVLHYYSFLEWHRMEDRRRAAIAIEGVGFGLIDIGRPREAIQVFGSAASLREHETFPLEGEALREFDEAWNKAVRRLPHGTVEQEFRAGRARAIRAIVDELQVLVPRTVDPNRRGIDALVREALAEYVPRDGGTAEWVQTENGWRLVFEGQAVTVRSLDGVRYMAFLIKRPGRWIHVEDLIDAVLGSALQVESNVNGDDGLEVSRGLTGVDKSDVNARDSFVRRVEEIDALVEQARAAGEESQVVTLKAERKRLRAELRSSFDHDGKPRQTGSSSERARVRVTGAIGYAINRIGEAHPTLASHLRQHIRTGTHLAYDVEGAAAPPVWTVSEPFSTSTDI